MRSECGVIEQKDAWATHAIVPDVLDARPSQILQVRLCACTHRMMRPGRCPMLVA